MRISILASPPISGSIDEIRFEAVGHCAFVKFEPEDSDSWVGVFGMGDSECWEVGANNQYAFVTAGGIGYYVDIVARKLLYLCDDFLVGVVNSEDPEVFVAFGYGEIYLYSKEGKCWVSDRIALDGIKNVRVAGNEIIGEAWSGDYFEFRIDLITKKITGDPPMVIPIDGVPKESG